MSGLRENSDQICSVIQVNVKGDPDEFKNWVKTRSSKYVLDLNEEKLISYEWHFSDDGREATLVELLVDSEGYMQRLKNHMASPIAAEISEKISGRKLVISTDQPGIQLYTGNHLSGNFNQNQGLCLETQHYPNSPNNKKFPSTLITPNNTYNHNMRFVIKEF